MIDVQAVIERYGMQENTAEGGYFATVYTAPLLLPANYGTRTPNQQLPICSSIYYLITSESFSALHRVTSDMLYHFYSGGPVEVLLLDSFNGTRRHRLLELGSDRTTNQQPTLAINAGTWMGSRVKDDGAFSLMGVSMAPAFDPANYEVGNRAVLSAQFPSAAKLIERYTRA